jgi:hypothetical protein
VEGGGNVFRLLNQLTLIFFIASCMAAGSVCSSPSVVFLIHASTDEHSRATPCEEKQTQKKEIELKRREREGEREREREGGGGGGVGGGMR